jgi:hypothetical protein
LIRSRIIIAGLAAAALTVPSTVAQATTSDPGPGRLCGFASITDPNTEGGGVQTGVVDGGPLVLVDDTGAPGSGTLVCTIQVGESTHVGTDQAGASAHGTGVVVLPPAQISYESPTGVSVYLCTEFIDDDPAPGDTDPTLYWNSSNDPTVEGSWSEDPNAACSLAIEAGGDDSDPVFDLLNATFCPIWLTIDQVTVPLGLPSIAEIWEDCEDSEPLIPLPPQP